MEAMVEYFYSNGDLMMCNVKLIVTFMMLQYSLALVSIIRDAMRTASF